MCSKLSKSCKYKSVKYVISKSKSLVKQHWKIVNVYLMVKSVI